MTTGSAVPQRSRWAPVVALGLAMLVVTAEVTIAAVTLAGGGVAGFRAGVLVITVATVVGLAALLVPVRRS